MREGTRKERKETKERNEGYRGDCRTKERRGGYGEGGSSLSRFTASNRLVVTFLTNGLIYASAVSFSSGCTPLFLPSLIKKRKEKNSHFILFQRYSAS